MSARTPSFPAYFEQATGRVPYAYQIELGEHTALPAVLDVPTGAGKTQAIIVSWLYHRRVCRNAPRRLVYALPMRALVEQTRNVVDATLQALGLQEDISVHVIQGGEPDTRSWREDPERDQILVGTIDMLLSRALGRGYGESRFAWPVSLGLLNNDCRWVFDEVQLMGPARATSAQLDGLRSKLGTIRPVQTLWASATVDGDALRTFDRPDLGRVLRLPPGDLEGALGRRLDAVKRLTRVDCGADDPKAVARLVAKHHAPGERTLVVLNRVRRAQDLYRALRRSTDAEVVLVHSRFREPERAQATRRALAAELPPAGRILVTTQVIEAGVDISAGLLVTETAPWSSLVQRLGRCNRYGEHAAGRVLWLDGGEASPRLAPPYRADDLGAARAELLALAEEDVSLSPRAVGARTVAEHREETAILRRRDLLDLFDTAPDLSGLDIDVSPFVRDADRHTVSVLFRELPSDPGHALDEPRATRREIVDVPIAELRDRNRWIEDFEAGGWRQARSRDPLTPGSTVLLAAADGGYDPELGWLGGRAGAVPALAPEDPERVESIAADPLSEGRSWVALEDHLETVREEAQALAVELAPAFSSVLAAAGALHDVGKAHAAFQTMLESSIPPDREPPEVDRLWAKSAYSGGRHERRFFRHELASVLGLLALDGSARYERRSLVEYLVAAHHGRVRLSIRPAPGEDPEPNGSRQALGVREGDRLPRMQTPLGALPPLVLSLEVMELGALGGGSWTARAAGLRDDAELGPLRLAFLEALLRAADWRAS